MVDPLYSKTIESYPIGDGLRVFRESFKLTCTELGISTSEALLRVANDG
jgi:hypothetical protein